MFEEIAQSAGLNFTTYVVDGERIQSPRQMMWCAEAGVGEYRFAANHVPGLKAHAFMPTLRRIRRDVEKAVGAPFNAVLINLYADGSEFSDWHSDDDPWLGQSFDVPSLSLGAARPFLTRRRDVDHARPRVPFGDAGRLPARVRALAAARGRRRRADQPHLAVRRAGAAAPPQLEATLGQRGTLVREDR